MSRIEQINELLRAELARLISQQIELPDLLITISRVKCSADLKQATIFFSVLPKKYTGTALRALKKNNSQFSRHFHKFKWKNTPYFTWKPDAQARFGAEMDKVFREMEND